MVEQLAAGLDLILTAQNVLMMVLGLAIGIVIGAIPGLNVPLAVALALPFSYHLPPLAALSLLIGIYKGGTYGGSISAILINVPGTPAAAATAMDGNALARQGKAGKALKASIYASVFGEVWSDVALILVAAPLAAVALAFGPPEYFAIGLFALTVIGFVSGSSLLRGLIAGAFGILLSTVGLDPLYGEPRLAFGVYELTGGIAFIALIIGLFAVAEALVQAERTFLPGRGAGGRVLELSDDPRDNRVSWPELRRLAPTLLRGTPLGIFVGAIPGLGSAIAAFLSYGMAKRLSDRPEAFGKGSLEGVAAAECANNAVCGSTLIPLLTLGIPGDVITALMLGALTVHGLIPGPTLFQQQGDIVAALLVGMLLTSLLHLAVAYAGLPLFIRAVRLPRGVLFPVVIVLCVTGTYVATSNFFDVFVMLGFGVLGYAMLKTGFPIPPLLIGFILGPIVEVGLRQSLVLSDGSPTIFLTRPVAAAFLVVAFAVVGAVAWQAVRDARTEGR